MRYPDEHEIVVDRKAARFAAWYEMFPRSQGNEPGKSATFDDCIARLPEIAALGFDTVYLVPIHPIGRINRKGKDNSTVAASRRSGQPLCDRFGRRRAPRDRSRSRARLPISGVSCGPRPSWGSRSRSTSRSNALPIIPGCASIAQWFRFRPDGTIKYAENPPKKYEDIVNVDFDNPRP